MSDVRDGTREDAAAVEAVWAAVAAEGEWIGTELPLRDGWQDRFRGVIDDPDSGWYIAEVDGVVVGGVFVTTEGGLAHLGMAILDGHRGRGLGKALLARAIEWARVKESHKLSLEVWPHNERARRLYESMGFVDEGYQRRHYRRNSGALWDAVVMGLVLDTTSPGRDADEVFPSGMH